MTADPADSIRKQLTRLARETNRPTQELLQYYGLERFLYRLSRSPHADRFVLKGAFLIRDWGSLEARATRDLDLLAFLENEVSWLESVVRETCALPVEAAGLTFDPDSIAGARIKEGADYEGVRIKLRAYLGKARIPIQLDVAFGDAVHPAPEIREYGSLLDLPRPRLRRYPREAWSRRSSRPW